MIETALFDLLVTGSEIVGALAVHSISEAEAEAAGNRMLDKEWIRTPYTVLFRTGWWRSSKPTAHRVEPNHSAQAEHL
jgi:hypothetical protein